MTNNKFQNDCCLIFWSHDATLRDNTTMQDNWTIHQYKMIWWCDNTRRLGNTTMWYNWMIQWRTTQRQNDAKPRSMIWWCIDATKIWWRHDGATKIQWCNKSKIIILPPFLFRVRPTIVCCRSTMQFLVLLVLGHYRLASASPPASTLASLLASLAV